MTLSLRVFPASTSTQHGSPRLLLPALVGGVAISVLGFGRVRRAKDTLFRLNIVEDRGSQ